MKARTLNYTAIFYREPEGGFTVVVPALPGCVTYGRTLEEAQEMAQDAIKGYIASLRKHKEEVPQERDTFVALVNLPAR